ncbi:MAG: 1-(5-phosphoribosyl)-5-[(5-phosphoribosylamino)methylideneamino] imidazole-4-carboxamide isomerase [Chloroflexi bacterium]|nr:1-(5-phosphoribosyl)-5-[(5-phosphoribosylamino)methylideneamino] imidazole-4-carboxamide isomerase [Chloroflexota bacterium]
MIIYPAIDLHDGKVVRLREGDLRQETVFSNNPAATAQAWIDQGAEWIHMVNLDGAFAAANDNMRVLEAVAKLDVSVQFAGGVRDLQALGEALDAGAARVMLGTLAVKQPEEVVEALGRFGAEAVGVALDARDGKVTTHGWTALSTASPVEIGSWFVTQGVRHALYTDVKRDGMLSGANIEDTVALARETGLRVIASGGISSAGEIERLAASGVVAGAIIGMALYQKRISLGDALRAAKGDG